jgi:hypothetical protein
LSRGLFSSAGLDAGTLLLLKVFSYKIDEDLASGRPLPRFVLDAGSGTGVLGICAARALGAAKNDWDGRVRAQDRDELARIFTGCNAALNGIPPAVLTAHAEPLLAGPPEGRWDLILSNVPAKTGRPVLADFVSRSAGLLSADGRVMIVVVNPLAGLFRGRIAECGLPLLYEEPGREHTVFIYGRSLQPGGPAPVFDSGRLHNSIFLQTWPAYFRGSAEYTVGKVSYRIDAFHGIADFDTPGGAVQTAIKLLSRREGRVERYVPLERGEDPEASPGTPPAPILVFEPAHGHFPAWLAASRRAGGEGDGPAGRWVFAGRNILSLEAARYNTLGALKAGGGGAETIVLPAVDPALDLAALAAYGPYGLIAFFPGIVSQTGDRERMDAWWAAFAELLPPGGFLTAALSASGVERFDQRKPWGFTRRGDIRRMGFGARLYERSGLN